MVNSLIALLDGLKLTGRAISSEGRLAYATQKVIDFSYSWDCSEFNNCDCNAECDCGDCNFQGAVITSSDNRYFMKGGNK